MPKSETETHLNKKSEESLSNGDVTDQTNPVKTKSGLMKLSSYVLALRPWSWSASLMPTLLGATIAYKYPGNSDFNYITLLLTLFTAVSVHGAGNVVNTYFDYVKGIDNRKSDDRILVDHLLSKDEVVSLGALLYLQGCIGFIFMAAMSPARMEHLALVYFGGLSSSFLYTGVLFSFLVQTGRMEWATMYYAIPLALNTEAILHSNNTRDSESDKKVGIVTLAILVGHTASHFLYAFLLFTPYVIFMVGTLKYSKWFALPLITLPNAFKIEKEFRSNDNSRVPKKTAKLNLFLGILYVLACSMATDLPYINER